MTHEPTRIYREPSSICSLGDRPLLMTGFLVQLFRQHFVSEEQIEEPRLRGLLWRNDGTSKIEIESATRWRPQKAEFRPAIIVRRDDYRVLRYGISDLHQGGAPDEGQLELSHFVQGGHTVFCFSRAPGQCELLSTEVFRLLRSFAYNIRSSMQLHRFRVVQVGRLQRLDHEATENFSVPITVNYVFSESWEIYPHAPKLKRVPFDPPSQ